MAANKNISGPKRRGLGGNLFAFRDDPLAFLEDAASYGEISHIRMGNLHAYLLNDPDLIHQVLVAHPEHYHKSRILKRTTNAIKPLSKHFRIHAHADTEMVRHFEKATRNG